MELQVGPAQSKHTLDRVAYGTPRTGDLGRRGSRREAVLPEISTKQFGKHTAPVHDSWRRSRCDDDQYTTWLGSPTNGSPTNRSTETCGSWRVPEYR